MRAIIPISDSVFLSLIFLSLCPNKLEVNILKGNASYGIFCETPLFNDFFEPLEISRVVNDSLAACAFGAFARAVVDETNMFWAWTDRDPQGVPSRLSSPPCKMPMRF